MGQFMNIHLNLQTRESAQWPIMQIQKIRRILIGSSLVTLSRSEGSIALGHEMLRCGSA